MSGGGVLHRLAVHLHAIAHRIPEAARADGPAWGKASAEERVLWERLARRSARFLVREGYLRRTNEADPTGAPIGPARTNEDEPF